MGYLRPKKHPWRTALLVALVALPLLYAVAGFLVLPPIVQGRAERELTAALRRPVTIGQVRLNPFTLAATVERLEVGERDGPDVFAGWDRLFVDFELASLWRDEWLFAAIELDAPHGRVVAAADGSLNFSDLVREVDEGAAPAAAPAAPPVAGKQLHIVRLVLNGARLDFRDEAPARPFATTLGPVSLQVRDFHTVSEADAPYTFEAVTEAGERLSWRGGIQAAPFRSKGELTVSDLVLRKYAPYYEHRTGLEVAGGKLTVQGRYEVNFDAAHRVLKLLEGSLALRDVRLVKPGTDEAVLELPAVDIAGASADGTTLTADVRQVALKDGAVHLRRGPDGTIDLVTLLRPRAPAAGGATATGPAAPAPPARTPRLTVGETSLTGFTVDVQDETTAEPAQFKLERVDFSLKDFTLDRGATMPVRLAFDWLPRGAVRIDGTISLFDPAAEVNVELDGIDAAPGNPYLAARTRARLAQGLVSLGGKVSYRPGETGPAATFDGQAWLERFSVTAGAGAAELGGFSDLVLSGVKVSTAPELSANVASVNLVKPVVHVRVAGDGTLNLAGLVRTAPSAAETVPAVSFTPAAPAPAAGPAVSVDRVVIEGGEISFGDDTTQPGVRLAITQLGGTLGGLSSAAPGRGRADLRATWGAAPLTIAGNLDPLAAEPAFDLKVGCADLNLLPLSPYVGKFAGFELARGHLTLDVGARLAAGQLDVANVATLDDFTLGTPTSSPDATKLPVRLGVALLKDREGRIVLDVPVRGRLDDPQFKVGRVVWRVITNLLAKAATSPFGLLGSMFGGGGDELGWQEFAPGSAVLSDGAAAKLDTVAKALAARPGLSLAIGGGFAPAADAAAIREERLQALVLATWHQQKARAEEKAPAEPAAAPPDAATPADTATPSAEEYAAALKLAFDRHFPPGTELGTPLPPAPPILRPPVHEDENLIKRLYHWVTFRDAREKAAVRREQEDVQREYLAVAQKVVDAGLPAEVMAERLRASFEIPEPELRALAEARRQAVRDRLLAHGGFGYERFVVPGADEPAAAAAPAPRVTLQLQ